jgi:hypothetical protein
LLASSISNPFPIIVIFLTVILSDPSDILKEDVPGL